MTTKAEWKQRALDAEAELTATRLRPTPTIDTLEVNFIARIVRFRGRTIEATGASVLHIPVLTGTVLYAPHHEPIL